MIGSRRRADEQLSFDLGLGVNAEVYRIDEADEHGEVFTRRWIVELIFDLAGLPSTAILGIWRLSSHPVGPVHSWSR